MLGCPFKRGARGLLHYLIFPTHPLGLTTFHYLIFPTHLFGLTTFHYLIFPTHPLGLTTFPLPNFPYASTWPHYLSTAYFSLCIHLASLPFHYLIFPTNPPAPTTSSSFATRMTGPVEDAYRSICNAIFHTELTKNHYSPTPNTQHLARVFQTRA